MGCVIDHLRADLRVRVLNDFQDLHGNAVRAGETGVIRRMDADLVRFQIFIEWERQGRSERLTFDLKSRHGPGNGRMRQFFEDLGTEEPARPAPSPPFPTPPEAPPSRPSPRRPSASLRGYDHRPPPAGLCLEELTVACDCDPAFHRPVVSETTGVHACLHCGAVTATRMVGDDGRFTGDAWTAHITVAVPEAHHEWLASWPRIRVVRRHPIRWPMAAELVRDDVIFIPAGRRFRSLEEVAEFEARLEADISRTPPGRRLRECGTPSARPPGGLASDFAEFSVLWQALQLRRGQALEELMPYAQRRCPGRFVASELILERPDRTEVTLDALWSSNPEWQSAGHVLALGLRPTPPELVTTVLQLLEDFPMLPNPEVPGRIAGCGRFESLLLLLADLGVNGPEVISVLQRLLRKVLQHDLQLVDPIRIVLRELRGDPAPSGFFLP